jgi:hypothetical protein
MGSILLASALLACEALGDPSAGIEPVTCEVVGEDTVPAEFETALGFSGEDVGSWLQRISQAELTYEDTGISTFLDVTASLWGDVTYREYGSLDSAATALCSDVLALHGTLQLYSRDGSFAESIDGDFLAASAEAAAFSAELDTWNGNYRITTFDPESYDAVRLRVDANFVPTDTTGTIAAQTEQTVEDGTVTVGLVPLATWVDEL